MFELTNFTKFLQPPRNQRGMALMVVVSLLAIMSLLGFCVLDTADVELNIAGNNRARQQAFYAAERALEYASTSASIYSTIGTGALSLDDSQAAIITANAADTRLMVGDVRYLTTGSLPPDSGSDPTYFAARIYGINVVTEGPVSAMARIEAQVSRVFPK